MAQVRPVTLNASKAGMTRLRSKGGASSETLWELKNGFVNASKCPQQRPGTTFKKSLAQNGDTANLPKGLCSFNGKLHTFCHRPFTFTDSTVVVDVLRHPTNNAATIATVWFAKPFMGFLYVVAEFSDGFIGHYWLQQAPAWKPNAMYFDNDMVQPRTPNGYSYQAQRILNPPSWTPLLQYKVADQVAPTTYDGYYFSVLQVFGPGAALTPPIARSGSVEPNWNIVTGFQGGFLTLEFSTAATPPAPVAGPKAPGQTPPGGGAGGRYGNRSGGFANP